MTEKWRLALDERKSIGIIFIDFQKAFDRVSHQILPQKLQASGLCGDSFDWIANDLNNRHQFVSINGTNSEKMRLTSRLLHSGIYLLQRNFAKCDLLYIPVGIFQLVG